MASSLAVALRRLASSSSPSSFLRTVRSSSSASRLFNTNAMRDFGDDDRDENGELDVVRRRGRDLSNRRADLFSDVFDPFSSTRSLSQVLNLMDQLSDNPILSPSRGLGAGLRPCGWDAKETEEGLQLRLDMPGLGKEDVKVSVEQNTLVIKGESGKDEENGEEGGRRYSSRTELPEKAYRTDKIRAEMKNGVLRVVVPKVKEEERRDVFHVNVE